MWKPCNFAPSFIKDFTSYCFPQAVKATGPGPIVVKTLLIPSGGPTGQTTRQATLMTVEWWCCSGTTSGGRTAAAWQSRSRKRQWHQYVNMTVLLLQQLLSLKPQHNLVAQLTGRSLKVIATCTATISPGTVLSISVSAMEATWPLSIPSLSKISWANWWALQPLSYGWEVQTDNKRYWN